MAQVEQKLIDEKLSKAAINSIRIKQDIQKATRTGRQPALAKETVEKRKKREDRVSGKSFDGSSRSIVSDNSSFSGRNNMMMIPEDDLEMSSSDKQNPCFGGRTSMQTS